VRKAAVLVDYPTYPLVYSYLYLFFLFFFSKLLHTFYELYLINITLVNIFSSGKGQCGTMYVQPYVQPTGPYRLSTSPHNISSLDYRYFIACVCHNFKLNQHA
jgi:hypothetical protein